MHNDTSSICVPCLSSEKLKLGLSIETKAWRDTYGKYCNQKYKQEMENIFDFIDDMSKRLQRPIKDLDDIRYAMQALKEIRENEIRIDMQIAPIEVSTLQPRRYQSFSTTLVLSNLHKVIAMSQYSTCNSLRVKLL